MVGNLARSLLAEAGSVLGLVEQGLVGVVVLGAAGLVLHGLGGGLLGVWDNIAVRESVSLMLVQTW